MRTNSLFLSIAICLVFTLPTLASAPNWASISFDTGLSDRVATEYDLRISFNRKSGDNTSVTTADVIIKNIQGQILFSETDVQCPGDCIFTLPSNQAYIVSYKYEGETKWHSDTIPLKSHTTLSITMP